MKAQQHTQSMLRWWQHVGIDRVDLAVKPRADGMIWHRDQALGSLPLAWTRAQNVHQAEVYIRPARGYDWPLVLLDDVDRPLAGRVPAKYEAMVVETSRAGGCHLWLACDRSLGEEARCEAQRWLAPQVGADLGSVSGEHLGRLAGFKNWKRGGCWVNVLDASYHGRRWDPTAGVPMVRIEKMRSPTPDARPADARCPDAPRLEPPDTSPSGREWGWVCTLLEKDFPPDVVYARLVKRARIRRGQDAERYARRTLQRALEHVERRAA